MTNGKHADRVYIFDTTLRDGEQSPGISLNVQEKLEIAHQLARLGVDIIEAGFPITSPGDFEAVTAIAKAVEGPVICGLARTSAQDIDAAWNAVKHSERPRIHTFIATSDIHIERKLQTTREDVIGPGARRGRAREAVLRRRRVLARGRQPLRRRVHGRGREGRRSRRARPRSTSPTRSATRCRTSTREIFARPVPAGARAEGRRGLGPLPRRPGHGGRELVRRPDAPARGRSSAP